MAIVLSENLRAPFYAPFYAAHASGAFTRAGVEVELRPSPICWKPRALRAGEVDVDVGGPLRVMIARDMIRSDLARFCDVVARDPSSSWGRRSRPDFKLPISCR